MFVVGLAAGTLPTGAISRAYGRRVAFIIGTGCGVATGLLGSFAILHASFVLFCCATFLGGLYGSVSQSYRFAATDGASPAFRSKAVSWVMAGGVFAGVLGPQLVQWTMDIWPPYLFAFSFVVQAAVALVAMAILSGVDAPKPGPADLHGGRPLIEIVRQPRFIAAAICGIVVYPLMNLVMTSAPLAMKICGLSVSDSNFGIEWHIVSMYAPSFKDRRGRPAAGGGRRDDRADGHHGIAFLGHADGARAGLELRLRWCFRAGAGDAPAAGEEQGSGLQ
jgi:MFS family permease